MQHGFMAALAGIVLMTPLSGVAAQEAASNCPAGAATLPPALAGWASPRPAVAASSTSGLGAATLDIGSAVKATLAPASEVHYLRAPEKPGKPKSYGGLLAFTIMQAGTYRVALGSGAWVDVLRENSAVPSVAHGHGPDCTSIKKVVDFSLTPGLYTLQIAANTEPAVSLMVARLP